jgi:hypothetical protein
MRPLAELPKHPDLDPIVAAFDAGDYRRVREQAPKLAAREDLDADVRAAAKELVERTEPDPIARWLLVLTLALLALLTAYWSARAGGGPPADLAHPPPPQAPPVERVQ